MRPKCHVRWLRFHFKRMLITGLGQQTLLLCKCKLGIFSLHVQHTYYIFSMHIRNSLKFDLDRHILDIHKTLWNELSCQTDLGPRRLYADTDFLSFLIIHMQIIIPIRFNDFFIWCNADLFPAGFSISMMFIFNEFYWIYWRITDGNPLISNEKNDDFVPQSIIFPLGRGKMPHRA